MKPYLTTFGVLGVLLLIGFTMHSPAIEARALDPTLVMVMNNINNPVPISLTPRIPFQSSGVIVAGSSHNYQGLFTDHEFAITAITIGNTNPYAVELSIHGATGFLLAGPNGTRVSPCSGIPMGGARPELTLVAAPNQTTHLTFPTPLVFQSSNGQNCIGVDEYQPMGVGISIAYSGYEQF